MRPGQSLSGLTARLLEQLETYYLASRPEVVLGHGDTTTCFAAALSGFYHCIPFFHVEAGLRTHRLHSPFPEEFNRQTITPLARHHFAPTSLERENLLRDGISAHDITVAGSTVHDAIQLILRGAPAASLSPTEKPLVVATLHRREAGESLRQALGGIREAARERPDALFVCPVHPSPAVRAAFEEVLGRIPNVSLTEPLAYPQFLSLLLQASLVVTDSGGVQEEAAYFGKKVLLARQETERGDGVHSGRVQLVGLGLENVRDSILRSLRELKLGSLVAQSAAEPASEIIAQRVKALV